VRDPYRECHRKKMFRTPKQARKAANRIYKAGGPKMRVYPCTVCWGYHLTTMRKDDEHYRSD
jgi:hypothetical protein